ncbi:MAG: FAD-dependent oxidoreductase [Gemmatimonadaceae bacterium]
MTDHDITRKDFINATLVGMGAALLRAPAPLEAAQQRAADTFTGPGGVGDYASSNGNTKAVMDAAHRIRDGAYTKPPKATDTGEVYDLVVVGGGITGLTAAYFFAKSSDGTKSCLVLDNHPIFGGEAKQNEFVVHGTRLIAPQGSNDFGVPRQSPGNWQSEMWDDLRMPREFEWSGKSDSSMTLRMAQDNYQPMDGIGERGVDTGYFIDGRWLKNVWQNDLAEFPVAPDVRAQLLRWRTEAPATGGRSPGEFARHLDTLTYAAHLGAQGYGAEVVKMVEPVIGLISGASPDAVSAHAAQQIGMPGVSRPRTSTSPGLSFPGGNVTYARHLVKKLIPDAIGGEFSFDGILNGRVSWPALDRRGQSTRIRVGTTVARVEHSGDGVSVVYAKAGRVYRVRARRVAMATGGWVTKHVLADIPPEMTAAYSQFLYAPALVINVALTNWRFMHRLGITAARWFGETDVGFVANIRRQMKVGSYDPPVDPDKPNVLTFYLGLYTPGKSVADQGSLGRAKLLGTSYKEYETAVLSQMTRQFSAGGFDVKRDVAGVILNRWGHARLVQPPGWYYGADGKPSPREVVAAGYGKIAIGHSELNGHQSATGAIAQGKRIAELSITS